MPHAPMLHFLGRACREAREREGRLQSHIAAALNANQETVGRFERGETWTRSPDRTVAGYASDLGTDPRLLWEQAIALWHDDQPDVDLKPLLEG